MSILEHGAVRQLIDKISISDTLLLASIPVAAYLSLFLYQSGYTRYFGVPAQYISFGLGEVLIIVVLLSFLVLTVIVLVVGIARLIVAAGYGGYLLPLSKKLPEIAYALLFIAAVVLIIATDRENEVLFILAAGLAGLLVHAFRWLVQKIRRKDLRDKQEVEDIEDHPGRPYQEYLEKLTYVLFSIIFCLYIIFALGEIKASSETRFFVSDTSPEMVVLFITDKHMVLSTFDRSTNLIDPGFTVIATEDIRDILLRKEEIGRLKLDDDAISPPP